MVIIWAAVGGVSAMVKSGGAAKAGGESVSSE